MHNMAAPWMGYRHYATATRVVILRTWSLEGDFPIDSCVSLSWINSFPDTSIRWETFFTVSIHDTINEKRGTSMVVHLDWELFHNKLLHKTWDSPFLGPGPQPRTHCNGPVILPKLYSIYTGLGQFCTISHLIAPTYWCTIKTYLWNHVLCTRLGLKLPSFFLQSKCIICMGCCS